MLGGPSQHEPDTGAAARADTAAAGTVAVSIAIAVRGTASHHFAAGLTAAVEGPPVAVEVVQSRHRSFHSRA
jgi:hypothetical protein